MTDKDVKNIGVRLPAKMAEALEKQAEAEFTNVSTIVRKALHYYLTEHSEHGMYINDKALEAEED